MVRRSRRTHALALLACIAVASACLPGVAAAECALSAAGQGRWYPDAEEIGHSYGMLGSVAAAVAITLITGLVTNRGVSNHPPLEILRQET